MGVRLSEFRIKYQVGSTLKALVLADSLVEMTLAASTKPANLLWTTYVDGFSNDKGSGTGLIVESRDKIIAEVSLAFSLTTSNNQTEYEACIASLLLGKNFNACRVEIQTNSLLFVSQIKQELGSKDVILQWRNNSPR